MTRSAESRSPLAQPLMSQVLLSVSRWSQKALPSCCTVLGPGVAPNPGAHQERILTVGKYSVACTHFESCLVRLSWVAVLVCAAACSAHHLSTRVPSDGRLDSILGPGIVSAGLVVEPQAGRRPLVRAIDRAQTRIFTEIYILTDSSVIRALERAAAQGVAVYVMLEHRPFGLGVQPDRMMDRLRAAGIVAKWTRPGFQLTHAKFVVIDDRLAIISSANFSRAAFQKNRDFLIFDRRAADVLAISALFRADWNRLPVSFHNVNLLVSPVNARRKIQMLISSAHRSVEIYAEEIVDTRLEAQLGDVARRGVQARVLLPWGGSPAAVTALARQGIRVRELRSPYIHAKLVSVDGREAYVGSENLSAASLDLNRELGILVRGSTVHRLDAVFASDWRRGAAPSP